MTLITASRAERGIVIFFVCLYLFKAKEINIFEEGVKLEYEAE